MHKKVKQPGFRLFLLLLALLVLGLQIAGQPAYEALRYDVARNAAQPWRLLTAHIVHLSWMHCVLNLAVLALCGACAMWLGDTRGTRAWALATATMALGISLLLSFFSPQIDHYAGLSGVLYGLLVWLLALPAWRGHAGARIALLFLAARVAWQIAAGPSPSEGRLIGGHVIAIAHVYGLAWGALLSGRQVLRERRR